MTVSTKFSTGVGAPNPVTIDTAPAKAGNLRASPDHMEVAAVIIILGAFAADRFVGC
jgi:hypothetical protein